MRGLHMNLKNMTILGLILFGMYVSSNVFACKDATSLLFQYAQEFAALETLSAPSCPYKLDPSDLTIKYFLIGDKIKKTILTLNSNDRFIFERFLDMYLAVHTEFVQSKSKSKRKELYTKAAEIVSNIFYSFFC